MGIEVFVLIGIGVLVFVMVIAIKISKVIIKNWLIISSAPIPIAIRGMQYQLDLSRLARVFLLLLALAPFYYLTTVYFKTGMCYQSFTKLSAEEMRQRTIKSYLSDTLNWLIRMDDRTTLDDSRIAIVPRKITGSELIGLINSSSMLGLLDEIEKDSSVVFIYNKKGLRNLDMRIFLGDFSIVEYNRDRTEMIYITTDEFIPVSAKNFFDSRNKFSFTLSEKINGYGNNFLTTKSYWIDPELLDSKKIKDSHIKKIMERDSNPEWRWHLIVSNCGDILARNEGVGNRARTKF